MMKRLKMLGMGCILLSIIFVGFACLNSGGDDPVAPVTTDTTSVTYSNATLIGTWLIGSKDGKDGPMLMHIVFNGNGTVTEMGCFDPGNPIGIYQVQPNGSFIITTNLTGVVSGTLTSATSGTVTSASEVVIPGLKAWAFEKVTNIAGCQGAWTGSFTEISKDNGTALKTFPVSFTIDSNGAVTSFTGFKQPVSGKMFTASGLVEVFLSTAESSTDTTSNSWTYSGINSSGTLSGNTITGVYRTEEEKGNFTLTRQ